MTTLQEGKDPPDVGGSDDASNWVRYGWTFVQPCSTHCPVIACFGALGCVLQPACAEGRSKGSRDKHARAGVWKCLGLMWNFCTVCWMPCLRSMVCIETHFTKGINRETVRQMRRVRKAKEPQKVKVELTWSMIVGSWGVIYWEGSAFRSWLFIPLCGKNRTEGHNTNKNTLTKKSQNAFRPILQYLQWSFQVWFKIQNIFCWIVLQLQFNLWCTIPCRIYDMSVLICLYTYMCIISIYLFKTRLMQIDKNRTIETDFWPLLTQHCYLQCLFFECAQNVPYIEVLQFKQHFLNLISNASICMYLLCFCPDFISVADSWIHRFSP